MGAAYAAAEDLTLTRDGDASGIPPDVLSALIDVHISRLQGDMCMILLSGVIYGASLRLFSIVKRS
jgi:hypothetical protein